MSRSIDDIAQELAAARYITTRIRRSLVEVGDFMRGDAIIGEYLRRIYWLLLDIEEYEISGTEPIDSGIAQLREAEDDLLHALAGLGPHKADIVSDALDEAMDSLRRVWTGIGQEAYRDYLGKLYGLLNAVDMFRSGAGNDISHRLDDLLEAEAELVPNTPDDDPEDDEPRGTDKGVGGYSRLIVEALFNLLYSLRRVEVEIPTNRVGSYLRAVARVVEQIITGEHADVETMRDAFRKLFGFEADVIDLFRDEGEGTHEEHRC